MSRLVKRPAAQGFVPKCQPKAKRLTRLKLAAVGAVSVLFSPLSLGVALAVPPSAYPLPTSYDNTFATQLPQAQLTSSTFQAIVCDQYGTAFLEAQGHTGGSNTYFEADFCALVTSDAQFYSTSTPRYYKFKFCTSDPTDYLVVGNLLAVSGDLRPYAKDAWWGTDTVQPTPNLTFDLCLQPKTAFGFPTGFVASGSSANYVYLRHSYTLAASNPKASDTVPENPQRAGFATGGLALALLLTNPANQTVFPYVQQGTAVYGTDYTGDSHNGVTITSNTITLPAFPNYPLASVGVPAPVYFNQTNHPAKTLQLALTAPAGYTFLGSPTWNAQINALNNATVSVSAINGQSTITPGSTAGGFVLTRSNGDQTVDLPVTYTIGGTAANGTDYGYLSGNATIPAGKSSLNVPIIAPQSAGSTAIPQKDVSIALSSPADNSYLVPASGATGQAHDFTLPAYNPSTVSFSQSSGGGTLTPGQPQQITVTRAGGDTSQALTIPYSTGGSATPGSDYNQLPGSVTLPAGQTSATIPVSAIQQTGTSPIPQKDLTVALGSGSGYTADPNATPIAYTIPAYAPTTVSVSSPSNGGAIPAGGSVPFTVTRTGDTTKALTIPYSTGGTATPGTDYNQLPGSLTIPAGATSATQTITTPTQTGSTSVPSKTLTLTPQSGSGYSVDPHTGTATYSTAAYAPSMVDFAAQGGTLTPGGTSDGFTVTRSGKTTQPLTVNLATGGSAQPGVDYGQLPASVTIPAGATSVTVPLRAFPQSGTTAQPQKDVQLTLQPGSGYAPSSSTPADYTIPAYTPSAGNPAVAVSVPNGQDTLLSPGTSTDAFTITRTGGTTAPLTVAYTTGGTGTAGTDYAPLSGTVTIPAGASAATVPIKVPSGATIGKTVAIALTPGSGYDQGTNSSVTYTIGSLAMAPNTPTVSLGFDASMPAFVVTRSGGDPTQALTLPLDFSGTGVPGVDYSQLPTAVTFGAGQTTATVPVKLLATATTGKTLTASIPSGSGYTVGSGNGSTFTVPAGYNDGSHVAATPTPTPTATKKGSSSGWGGAAGFAAGAAGLGSIALGTGAGGSAAGAAAAAVGTLAIPGLLAGSTLGAIPPACSTTGETPSQLAKLLPQLKQSQPNWNTTTFASLPAPSEPGSVKLGNVSRTWKAGQPVADIVRVGDTDGTFNLYCLGLSKLASLGRMGMATKPLSTLNLTADTTVQGVSQTLYLRAKTVGDVNGLAEWLAAKSGGTVTAMQLAGITLADALKANPSLASLPMGNLPLHQLPGYNDLLLGDIPNWRSATVSQIVGLKNVPFSQFPTQPKPLSALLKAALK